MLPELCVALLFAFAATDRVQTLREAAALLQAQQLERAQDLLDKLLAADPKDPLALNLLGVLRVEQHHSDQAEKLFREALQTGHPLAGPRINLAKLYAQNRPEEAIQQLAEALKTAPDNRQAAALLLDVSRTAASAAMRAGDPQKALQLSLAACKAKPHDAELLYDFGMVASDAGLKKDAERSLAEALNRQPDLYDAEYGLARVYLDEGAATQAEELMRKYLAARPTDASAQYGLGYVLVAEQKLDEAKTAFQKSLELQPGQTESAFQMGDIAQQQGDTEAARRWFQQVLARDSRHAGALTGLAILDFRASQYQQAQSELEAAIAAAPSYQKAHYYYALVLTKLGHKDEAAREFATSRSLEKTKIVQPSLAVTPQ